eukprot:TRINITY_DN25920_c0_g1_i1.p1 TRINITY_DN25920_c0_g1~~TRINITY_DN25920_c0_g1_i1.p1  ORF type:complete len:393 (+),score=47.24 TRINITY_DN25920_c0_g1_i1:118-1296(+)
MLNSITPLQRKGPKSFIKKYFFEGQKLSSDQEDALSNLPPNASLRDVIMIKYRKVVGILIPLAFFQVVWWTLAVRHNYFQYFPDKYLMSITMIFGAMIAGMTSEGGGAVAFPVMTLVLHVSPSIARDFSLMIQAMGMTAAAFTIFFMKIQLEYHSIFICSFGALFGMITGLEVIDGLLDGPTKKLGFVCIWFSFAFALFLLNREHKRKTYDGIPGFGLWHGLVLLFVGFLGGIFSAISGSGVDICSFSILTLLFRVSEKVATPTSIVLMAINTCVGFFWRALISEDGIEEAAWEYVAVCVPIVVICAPFGSFLSSHFHRQVLAFLIYILDTVALITAFIVIPINWQRGVLSACLIFGGFVFFFILSTLGEKFIQREERRKDKENPNNMALNA